MRVAQVFPEGHAPGALQTSWFMHQLLHQVFNRKELRLLVDMKGWQSRSRLLAAYILLQLC